jgi:large subunit ribosomal protein L10
MAVVIVLFMPQTRQQKEEKVQKLTKYLEGATSAAIVAFDKITVGEMNELRTNLAQQKTRLQVIPKRLMRLIVKTLKLSYDPTEEEGQMAVAWGNDAVAPAKTLYTFIAKHPTMNLVAGILEGKFLNQSEIVSLAKLPGREELLGALLSVVTGPVRGLQAVLTGAQLKFVYGLKAVADHKQKTSS